MRRSLLTAPALAAILLSCRSRDPHPGDAPAPSASASAVASSPPAPPASFTGVLPGACEPIPERRFRVQKDMHPDKPTWTFATVRAIDLDGDGVLDAMVPSIRAGECPGTMTWDLYVVRGACGHHVGTVGGQKPEVRGTGPTGFVDLECSRAYSGAIDFRTCRFDGTSYTVLENRHSPRHPLPNGKFPPPDFCRVEPLPP